MNESNQKDALAKAFRNNGYNHAEVEFPTSFSTLQNDKVIDLEAIDKNTYTIPTSTPSIPMLANNRPHSDCTPSFPIPNVSQRFTLEDLKPYQCSWEKSSTKPPKSNKDYIELTSPSSLSDEFRSAIGEQNSSNIQGIDDERLKDSIFIGFLEQEACRQFNNKSNHLLESLFSIQTANGYVSGHIENNTLYWVIGYGTERLLGFVALIQALLTIPYMGAVATLTRILNVNMDYLFSVFDVEARVTFS